MKLRPIPKMNSQLLLRTSILIALSMAACSPALVRVKPYERGNLAKPVMEEDINPLQTAMTEHAYFSREASFGGGGVGGGGCGCN